MLKKRAFYPLAQEVLVRETLLATLRQVAKQGQRSAFQVESKTNPQKEMVNGKLGFLYQLCTTWEEK